MRIEQLNDKQTVEAFDKMYYAIKNNPRKYLNTKYGWKEYFSNTILELRKSEVINELQSEMLKTYFFEIAPEDYDYGIYFEESIYRNIYLKYHKLIKEGK